MKTLLIIISTVIAGGLVYFFYLGFKSQTGQAIGLVESRLSRCPMSPNCICTEYPVDKLHFTNAIEFTAEQAENLPQLIKHAIQQSGGTIVKTENNYIAASFTSKIFRYVDDFEVRIDGESQLIHLRSASRVGHSDMGANLQRIEAFKQLLEKQ